MAIALIYHALCTRNVGLFLAALGLLLLGFLLFQYHCLDCGSTGWYLHAKGHACGPVVDRCARRGPAARGLSARTQRLIWVYILVAAVLGGDPGAGSALKQWCISELGDLSGSLANVFKGSWMRPWTFV